MRQSPIPPVDNRRAQLDALRARIRLIESRRPVSLPIEQLPGSEVETVYGRHLEVRTTTDRHGGFHFSRLEELPVSALAAIADGAITKVSPYRIAFLDSETTGAVGGEGTIAFLVGIGRITDRGFLLRQYLMRSFAEEASVLHAVAEDLRDSELLITYNGKTYDEPLLDARYGVKGISSPFGSLQHLDLLHGARRLWKLRFDSCRLVELESQVLAQTREDDVAGHRIPHMYFEYLRTKRPAALRAVLKHNALDILSLAALTSILPGRFENYQSAVHAAELVGLGRWLILRGDREEAIPLFEKAIARIEFDRLPSAHKRDVFIELAKHYERRKRDPVRALEMALEVLTLEESEKHVRRSDRLRRMIERTKPLP